MLRKLISLSVLLVSIFVCSLAYAQPFGPYPYRYSPYINPYFNPYYSNPYNDYLYRRDRWNYRRDRWEYDHKYRNRPSFDFYFRF